MLYRGSDIMREVAWVIFSLYAGQGKRYRLGRDYHPSPPIACATYSYPQPYPNAMQFADWISKSHDQPCHVVYTNSITTLSISCRWGGYISRCQWHGQPLSKKIILRRKLHTSGMPGLKYEGDLHPCKRYSIFW